MAGLFDSVGARFGIAKPGELPVRPPSALGDFAAGAPTRADAKEFFGGTGKLTMPPPRYTAQEAQAKLREMHPTLTPRELTMPTLTPTSIADLRAKMPERRSLPDPVAELKAKYPDIFPAPHPTTAPTTTDPTTPTAPPTTAPTSALGDQSSLSDDGERYLLNGVWYPVGTGPAVGEAA